MLWLIWLCIGSLFGGFLFNFFRIQSVQGETLAELQRFKNVGARFTATDGAELCEYVAQLRRLHGMTEPPCDYTTRAGQ